MDYYGDWIQLTPCQWGCKDCGAEYFSVGELRWCPTCQANIWNDDMEEYRRLRALAHSLVEDDNVYNSNDQKERRIAMDIETEAEMDVELQCPHCGQVIETTVKGNVTVTIEPKDYINEGCD